MLISYCDICSAPIKDVKYWLVTMQTKTRPISSEDYITGNGRNLVKDKEQEICENCYSLIQQIFEYRNLKMLSLAEDCKTLYEKPTKEPKKAKRNKDTKD